MLDVGQRFQDRRIEVALVDGPEQNQPHLGVDADGVRPTRGAGQHGGQEGGRSGAQGGSRSHRFAADHARASDLASTAWIRPSISRGLNGLAM